ncbi:MAG: PqiC family protein [Pseudomonadota bacterium]
MNTIARGLGLLLTLGIAACATAPPPTLYKLPLPSPVDSSDDRALTIAIADVELPAYARSNLIASIDADYRIDLDDNHRWASPPAEAITRTLAAHLERQLDADVLVRPYPRTFQPQLTVTVQFDEFVRSADGAALMRGRAVLDIAGSRGIEIVRFSIRQSASATRIYSAYMTGVSKGLMQLAERIDTAISASLPVRP